MSKKQSNNYLYRVLRDDEDVSQGISAKSPSARRSIYDHVNDGSYNPHGSQWISTSASREAAEAFATRSRGFSSHGKTIAKINTDKIGDGVRYVDLTNSRTRVRHLPEPDFAHNCASKFEEVLVRGNIPAESIEELYSVHPDGSTTRYNNNNNQYSRH